MSDLKSFQIEMAWRLHHAGYTGENDRAITGLLDRLAEAQNWRCCYCGLRMDEPYRKTGSRARFEHIVPRSRGGSDRAANLAIARFACNQARGTLVRAEHLEVLATFPRGMFETGLADV